uniref:hypothetical protein n=1 Tax=Actinobacillus pleuropneumoniae TaxID=715 RepID=UPI00155D882A|nr:hypothetical protein [Actinobacillus pleuropneumoniae]
MKKYVLLLVAVLSAAISVTGFANSGSTVETTVKMFKPENQALAREFLTVKEKSTKPNLVKLINNELNANVLFEEEHEGKKFVRIKDNVTKEQVYKIEDLAQSITDSATKENNMRAAVYSASLVNTANVKKVDFKLKAR